MRLLFLGLVSALGFPQDPDVSRLSGKDLISRLENKETRKLALLELLRRGGDKDAKDPKELAASRRDPELVVCPQPEGASPLYVVLSLFLPEREPDTGFGHNNRDRLFAKEPRPLTLRKKDRVIDVFDASGTLVRPFGGNNVVNDGYMMDVNGDGFVERVDSTSYGIKGAKTAQVLTVATVFLKPRPLFAVVVNFDLEKWAYMDWWFDLTNADRDGAWDIHLGPKIEKDKIDRKVAYRWDEKRGTWNGPTGGAEDHFRVIDGRDVWKGLKGLRDAEVSFPRVPERRGVPPQSHFANPVPPTPPADEPYKAASLSSLTDEEIVRAMGRKAVERPWQRAIVPADFWVLSPKEAALGLVERNRTVAHRKTYRLAVDDLDGVAPPKISTVTFTDQSSRCYNAVDTHWTLKCDPKGSWLAFALRWEEGVALKGRVRDGKVYDLKIAEMTYEEARHVAELLWWLSRVRSHAPEEPENSGLSFSTGDGKGFLDIVPRTGEKARGVSVEERIWMGTLAGRWPAHYTRVSYLNFAHAVIEQVLPDRLGDRWPKSSIRYFKDAGLEEEKPGQIERMCIEMLRMAASQPSLLSKEVSHTTILAAGEMGLASALPDLRKLAAAGSLKDVASRAISKIESSGDLTALERAATKGHRDEAWALTQLRRRFPERHRAILKERLTSASGQEALGLFRELRVHYAEEAFAFASTVSPDRRDLLAVEACALLVGSGKPVPQEHSRLNSMIAVARDTAFGWEARGKALDILVPHGNPGRFTEKAIEETLVDLLDPTMADVGVPFTRGRAVGALVRRTGGRHAEAVVRAFNATDDSFVKQSMLPSLVRLAQSGDLGREKVLSVLRDELETTDLMLNELAIAVWAAGLRELKNEIERIATASPDSPEGERANTAGGGRRPVEGRCHVARKVASLWNEKDVATRLKLLAAFATEVLADSGKDSSALREHRLDMDVVATVKKLDAKDRREALRYLDARAHGTLTTRQSALLARIRRHLTSK